MHAVVAGAEAIGYAPVDALQPTSEEPDRDMIWLSGDGDLVTLRPGHFLVAWPGEGHMPGLAVGAPVAVKKIVVKVAVTPWSRNLQESHARAERMDDGGTSSPPDGGSLRRA